jgi:hypothetical protein
MCIIMLLASHHDSNKNEQNTPKKGIGKVVRLLHGPQAAAPQAHPLMQAASPTAPTTAAGAGEGSAAGGQQPQQQQSN